MIWMTSENSLTKSSDTSKEEPGMKRVYLWAADKAGCWTYRMKFPMQSVLSGPNGAEFEIDSDPRIPQDWIDKSEVAVGRSEGHTSELQSRENLVCRLLLEKKKPYL